MVKPSNKNAVVHSDSSRGQNGNKHPTIQYIFTFEMVRNYPTKRGFILKKPLKRPIKDVVFELFNGGARR
ncbi:hypothetical protein KKF81_04265 [Candidatus Micrarchaeota archaeon]|nr:hypothetical protein [Candidatus Micrarchaeota archaeon]MBU1166140.1 hypothetical protein [Candidatus Micrarchaeota archaeon]MBU1887317.1 hypothetical protein [Candidatus Micrarchaeota archaeon]